MSKKKKPNKEQKKSDLSQKIVQELWSSFAEETTDLLDNIEQELLKLEKEPGDSETIASLFRSMHTFKGATGVMSLPNLEHITHAAEDLMMLVRDEGLALNAEHIDTMFKALDVLSAASAEIVDTHKDYDSPELQSVTDELRGHVNAAAGESAEDSSEDSASEINQVEAAIQVDENAVSEKMNPLDDEEYVKIYFELVWENLSILRKDIDQLSSTYDDVRVKSAKECLDNLQFPSQQIGLLKVSTFITLLLEDLDHKDCNFSVFAEQFNLLSSWLWEIDDRISFGESLDDFIEPYVDEVTNADADKASNVEIAEETAADLEMSSQASEPMSVEEEVEGGISLGSVDANLQGQEVESYIANAFTEPRARPADTKTDEHFDPSTDPLFALDYLEKVQTDIEQLRQACQAEVSLEEATNEIKCLLNGIVCDAQRMSYERISVIAKQYLRQLETSQLDVREYSKFEISLFEELARVESSLDGEGSSKSDNASGLNISYVFNQWHSQHIYEAIAELNEFLFTTETKLTEQESWSQIKGYLLANQTNSSGWLSTVQHTCTFLGMAEAESILLVLSDVFIRLPFEHGLLSQELIDICKQFFMLVGEKTNQIYEETEVDSNAFEQIKEQIHNLLNLKSNSPTAKLAEDFLDNVGLPSGFYEILDTSILENVGDALKSNSAIYLIRADIEQDETLADGFFELLKKDSFDTITSATGYEDDRTFFHFLITSKLSVDELEGQLKEIDETAKYLQLIKLEMRATSRLASENFSAHELSDSYQHNAQKSGHGLERAIGQLISSNSNIRQLKEQLAETDLFDNIDQILKRSDQDWRHARQNVREALMSFEDDVREMFQVQDQMEVAIETLQSTFSEANEVSVKEVMENIRSWSDSLGLQLDRNLVLKYVDDEHCVHLQAVSTIEHNLKLIILLMAYSQMFYPKNENTSKDIVLSISTQSAGQKLLINIEQENDCTYQSLSKQLGELADANAMHQWLDKDAYVLKSDSFSGINLHKIQANLNDIGGLFKIIAADEGLRFQLGVNQGYTVSESMVVRIGDVSYVIAVQSIKRIISPSESDLVDIAAEQGRRVLKLEGAVIPIDSMHGHNQANIDLTDKIIVVLQQDDSEKAIVVDQLLGIQQIMVHPLTGQLENIRGVSGCAILGKDQIGMVLDVTAL